MTALNRRIYAPGADYPDENIETESHNEDIRIWDDFRSGCESSFIYIYERHISDLYDYGCKFSADHELVKDAIQDLFIELRVNRNKLGKTGSIKFYLYKSLKRKIIRETRKWIYKMINLERSNFFDFTFSHEHHLINKQLKEEQIDHLNNALKKLSPRQKEMVYYYFFEDLSYEQIKDLMDFSSLKATRNLLYRTIGLLKSAVQLS